MPKSIANAPVLVSAWIICCTFFVLTGWLLSAAHQLNATGYLLAFALAAVAVWFFRHSIFPLDFSGLHPRRLRRRFSRPLPLCFLVLAALSFLGGVLYPPANYDGLAYRTPRVLHWLAERQWHWIHTEFQRLNTRAVAFEFLTAPILLFARTDRFLFLINTVSFLLLPGLIFSMFRRLEVRPRVAWWCMWILPSGCCFLLQAGGIANDLFTVPLALAMVDFALRARSSRRIRDLWLSLLAAALLTSGKGTTIPLLLVGFIAALPALSLLKLRLAPSLLILAIALTVSFVPTALMNVRHVGDWTGASAEWRLVKGKPLPRFANNAWMLTIENLVPPAFPAASKWNNEMDRLQPASWRSTLESIFEPSAAHWYLGELEAEEWSGLGMGLTLLCAGTAALSLRHRFRSPPHLRRDALALSSFVFLGAIIALMAFMFKSGLSSPARLITPYYLLLLPAIFRGPHLNSLIKSFTWKMISIGILILALVPLFLSPSRPLFPP